MENMLITREEDLRRFYTDQRIWQGIPSIEVTPKGRIFITFYSGGVKEHIGNYAMIVKSDNGKDFGEPIAAVYLEEHRCFDPCLWIDPLGRLWFTWSICPDDGLWGVICEDPDADELVWGEQFFIGNDIMMNKPTVLSTGEWLFPLAVWAEGVRSLPPQFDSKTPEKGSFVYKTCDHGESFVKLGGADVPNRSYDEHMVLELQDGRLMMLVRTHYGIGVSYSVDRGKTWSEGVDSGLGGPSSRFYIRRLKSGRILLVNHVNFVGRTNLTALLSEDDGKTWCGQLLLDERYKVSYPDAVEAEDGYIYITYDRERGAFKRNMQEAQIAAREILMARITEEDILCGELKNDGSFLKRIVSKLGEYKGPEKNPYKTPDLYTDKEYAQMLMQKYEGEERVERIFDCYTPHCADLQQLHQCCLDEKIEKFVVGGYNDERILSDIVGIVRELSLDSSPLHPTVERIMKWVDEHLAEEMSVTDIADALSMSYYYLCHFFKKETGTTVLEYRNECRLTHAKRRLIGSDDNIGDIAHDCGFGSASYFNEVFLKAEGITPSAYRKLNCK